MTKAKKIAQRKETKLKDLNLFEVEKGFNPRQDKGDLGALAEQLKRTYEKDPYEIPAVRGHLINGGPEIAITDGHRRFAAAQIAGIPSLPFLPMSSDPLDRLIATATMNSGKDLNEMEKAHLIERIEEEFFNQNPDASKEEARQLCINSLGIAQSSYYNYKKLLGENISKTVRDLVASNKVSSTVVINEAQRVGDARTLTQNIQKMVKDVEKTQKSKGSVNTKATPTKAQNGQTFPALPLTKKIQKMQAELADSQSKGGQLVLTVFSKLQDKETTLEEIMEQVNKE